jgi:hypothetical protein
MLLLSFFCADSSGMGEEGIQAVQKNTIERESMDILWQRSDHCRHHTGNTAQSGRVVIV